MKRYASEIVVFALVVTSALAASACAQPKGNNAPHREARHTTNQAQITHPLR